MKPLIITIDGPAASGKGTIANYIKKEFKFYHIDSGLLYRKIAKIFLEKKIDINNKKQFVSILKNIKTIPISNSKKLRTLKVSKMTSEISKISKIRNLVNFNQREILNKNRKKYRGFVIDGRDIGSVVFKNAQIKLFIRTSPKIRAKRRFKELNDRGEKSIYSNVLKEIKLRDKTDINRKNSPLVIPSGAIIVNNSNSLKATNLKIKKIITRYLES